MKSVTLNRKIRKFNNSDDRLYFTRQRLSNDEYHKCHQAVSSSALKDLYATKNPAFCHAKYIARIIPNKQTPAMMIGDATHCLTLEPRQFKKRFAIWTGGRKSGGEWKMFVEDHSGKTILKQEEYDQIRKIRDCVMRNPEANKLLTGCVFESSVFWRDPETGLLCRARADAIKQGKSKVVIDLKTTLCAEPNAFTRDLIKMNYPIQASMYLDGFQADAFAFIAVEKGDFNTCQVYSLDDDFDATGNYLYRQILEQWAECRDSGKWPTYAEGIKQLKAPEWWVNKIIC